MCSINHVTNCYQTKQLLPLFIDSRTSALKFILTFTHKYNTIFTLFLLKTNYLPTVTHVAKVTQVATIRAFHTFSNVVLLFIWCNLRIQRGSHCQTIAHKPNSNEPTQINCIDSDRLYFNSEVLVIIT